MRWEYAVFKLVETSTPGQQETLLDKLGYERWELVTVTSGGVVYMKRQVQ